MLFFNNDKKRRMAAMAQRMNPSSKASLKRQCLMWSDGDLKEAKEMYDFWIEGLDNLPEVDPVEPSWVDTFGTRVNSVLGWARDNQGVLSQGLDMIAQLFGRRVSTAAEVGAEALEEINE